MAEKNCGTCVKWKSPDKRVDYTNAVSFTSGGDWEETYEQQEKADKLFGVCEGVRPGFDLDATDPLPMATVVDGSQYLATLFTRAEFYCALYSDKEEDRG